MKILKIPLLLFVFCLFLVLIAGGLIVVTAVLNTPTGDVAKDGVLFQISKGESSEHIFIRLEQEKIIRSSLLLRIISKLYNSESALKSGIYRIKPDQTTLDIHNLFVSGKQEMKRITVKEGWTAAQVARSLEQEGLLSAQLFIQASRSAPLLKKYGIPGASVEGFLFPETYYFPQDVSAEIIIAKMMDTFFEKLAGIVPEYKNLAPEELFKKVIIASIIEREYRKEDEAPVIASVFYNRLKIGQKLESCATVAYVLTDILGRPHPDRLTYADLEVQSPYNTYLAPALPPGPIGNPGATALISSFFPADTTYRYFLLKDPATGVHEFSESFQKHLTAKELYIKSY
jgi:UPF0755 protein